ncbi:MAG: 4Fe-4S dicluster domain-containing protein [Caldiserica bacterium]|nr:4Fe-4S dicluster domain-containing protein [Caldisericota bacterium]
MSRLRAPEELLELRDRIRGEPSPPVTVAVCGGTGCRAFGAEELLAALRHEVDRRGLSHEVSVKMTGCHGFCEHGPIVVVQPQGYFYPGLRPEDVPRLLDSLRRDEPVEELLYVDPVSGHRIPREEEVPFYRGQRRVVLAANGQIDPTSIHDYIGIGGYSALATALAMAPEEVIEEVKRSGLRGRGGAGFPTGRKWELCRRVPGDKKYVVCNADEGDPGAYMDRSVLEGNPHAVIEGMIIGAYAVGADEGYVYVRAEYPLAVEHLRTAIAQAEELGLLGDHILGTGFSFRLHVFEGAGAFVCGEETALIASIEGRRGQPRPRPPYPVESGLFGKPTVINNVETWANVPHIIGKGADWFRSLGTEGSPGTKIFSLTGRVRNTGLVEVPMGTTLRELIFGIGGGPPEGRRFKAVQIGGPSGGCLPEELLDLPIDYESLTGAGAMMGSGGMVVLDEGTCMVELARFFLEFTQAESCGQCPPCRIGTKRMLEILERITRGRGRPGDLELLEELAWGVREASLCGLGRTAPNPVLTTLRYFRTEYEAHLAGRCPAGICRDLIAYSIDPEVCVGCGLCTKACPQGAIVGEPGKPHRITVELCIRCGACAAACPKGAIGIT